MAAPSRVAVLGGLMLVAAWFYPCLDGRVLGGSSDLQDQILPLQVVARSAWRAGEVPQWNPYIFCGTTFARSGANAVFYPPHLLYALIPVRWFPEAATLLLGVHVAAAGAASVWYCAGMFRTTRYAVFAAATYLLSLPIAIACTHGLTDFLPFLMLPLLLGLTRRWRGGSAREIMGAALLFWWLWTGTNLQMSAYVTISVVLAVACRAHALRNLPALFLALVIALGSSLFYLVPFALDIGASAGVGAGANVDHWRQMYGTSPAELLRLFMPDLFGRSDDSYGGSNNPAESFPVYCGVFPALLAVYGLLFLHGRSLLPLRLACLLIPLIVCNTPAVWLHRLLFLDLPLMYSRVAFLLPLPLSLLAARTAAHLADRPRRWRGFLVFVAALGSALVMAACGLPLADGSMAPLARGDALRHFVLVGLVGVPCLMALAADSLRLRRLAFALFLLLTLVDVWSAVAIHRHPGWPFLIPRTEVWPVPPSAPPSETLATPRSVRVQPAIPELFGWRGAVHGVYSPTGYDNLVPSRVAALLAYPGIRSRQNARAIAPASLRPRQLTSTAFILTATGAVAVPGYLPRLACFTDFLVIADDRQALDTLFTDTFPYATRVVLSEAPSLPMVSAPCSARLLAESPNRLVCATDSVGSFLLLLNDTFAPGWRLDLDGQPWRLIRANTAFRACVVPAGRHRLTFVYAFPWHTLVGGLSALVATVALLFTAKAVRTRPR